VIVPVAGPIEGKNPIHPLPFKRGDGPRITPIIRTVAHLHLVGCFNERHFCTD